MTAAPARTLPTAVLGAGQLGTAVAAALATAGVPTTCWSRSGATTSAGVTAQPTVAAAVDGAALVLLCLPDQDAVVEVLQTHGGLFAGRTVASLATLTSGMARADAEAVGALGAQYLGGAVLGPPAAIGTDTGVLLWAGPPPAFGAAEPTLRVLGGRTTYLGPDVGLPALYELALLSILWSVQNGFLQAAALLGSTGAPAASFAPFLANGLTAMADWLPGYAGQIDAGDFPADDGTLTTHLAAMQQLLAQSEDLGLAADLPRLFIDLAQRAVDAGHGRDGYPALIAQFTAGGGARS